MRYFVSADIGTQGTKAAVVDEEGRILVSSFRASRLIRGNGGSVEEDPEALFAGTLEAIAEAVALAGVPPRAIEAIAMDGQMAGIMGIDREWNPVTPYDSWLDTRCGAVMPEMKAWGEAEIAAVTGCPVTYAHGPKQLWWKRERPEAYKRIAKFVVPAVFAAGRLAGLGADEAYIDHTYLHFSGFADTEGMEWSEPLLKAFGMEPSKQPEIVPPWKVIGHLQSRYAEAARLPAGIPIAAGCGDTAACALGAGLTAPGRLLDVAGTASVLACGVDRFRPDTADRTLLYARSVLPGLYTPLAYISGGGECIAWFRRLTGRGGGTAAYDELNRAAAGVPAGSGGLTFIPHFGGRVCPNDTSLRGGWTGLNWGHGEAEMYRSLLEAVAYEYAGYLAILERLAGPVAYSHVHAVGGGSASALFNQIKSDVLGIPYRTLRNQETALSANALIAGYGIGLVSDLGKAAARQSEGLADYEPDPAATASYKGHAARYRKVLKNMSSLYEQLKGHKTEGIKDDLCEQR